MAKKITTSNLVPSRGTSIYAPLVNTNSQPLLTHSNPQTPSPGFPVLFADQVTVPSGGEQVFRSEAFTNNLGRPVELHSLRFNASILLDALGNSTSTLIRSPGTIALSISVAGVPVTRGVVPMWAMCRSDNRRAETSSVGFLPLAAMCWYFSHPIPLRPGEGITLKARHLGVVPAPVLVGASFAGRVSPAPIPNRVPFVASWTSKAFSFSEVGTDTMPPDALANDTERDLHIDRIIGRAIAYDDASTGLLTGAELTDFSDVSVQAITAFLVRLGLSQSRPILKTYTPWRTVFGQNAAVEMDTVLRPGDYFTADVSHTAGTTPPTPFTFSQNRAMLSVIGWREV